MGVQPLYTLQCQWSVCAANTIPCFSMSCCAYRYSVHLDIYTPRNEVRGGVYWNHPVRPSVRPSVCLSVRLSVDARLGKMVSSA